MAAPALKGRIDTALVGFLDAQGPVLAAVAPELAAVGGALSTFLLDGGKRLRPAFAYWGARGGGHPDGAQLVAAAASLELLQACALIHDDVMDGSDTRRGQPSMHRRFAAMHRDRSWQGDPDAFGTAAAVLLGDMCLIWGDRLLDTCGLPEPALRRARPVHDLMRTEVMAGQYLDLLEQVEGSDPGAGPVERAMRVARYKSAKYTIERPLHLGAALAGAAPALVSAYSSYGLPLGEAFQLRDDVLGVFGDPAETGKPAGDDLREGKRTVLVAAALDVATPAQAAVVRRLLGDPALDVDGVDDLRSVLVDTGALDRVEALVDERTDAALTALASAPVEEEAREALGDLAAAATRRRV